VVSPRVKIDVTSVHQNQLEVLPAESPDDSYNGSQTMMDWNTAKFVFEVSKSNEFGRRCGKLLSPSRAEAKLMRSPKLVPFASVVVACFFLVTAGCHSTEQNQEHLAPGELLASGRDIPPADFRLRPMYPEGIKVTKESEGWVPRLYNDSANYCTIGYGHLIKKAPCNGTEPQEFLAGLTEPRGSTLLETDMASAQYTVMTSVQVPMSDGQYAALTDFVFNVGSNNFRNSTLLKSVNGQQADQIATQFRRWVLAGGKSFPGLVKRRDREVTLYFEGQPVPRALPSPEEPTESIDIRVGESR